MSDEGPAGGVQRMRANRKVIETTCLFCGQAFRFGEDVCACAACRGYYHVACYETGKACPHSTGQIQAATPAGGAVLESTAPSAAPVAPVPDAAPAQASPATSTPAATDRGDESLIVDIRRQNEGKSTDELLAAYRKRSKWFSEDYFEAIRRILVERGVDDPSLNIVASKPEEVTTAPVPARPALGPDEMYCPQCSEIVKSAALKCRFCNATLDQRLAASEVPAHIVKEIAKNAKEALTYGILGLCICAPIFGSMAISRGNAALRDLDQYPLYDGPRGKAKAGLVLGWVDWGLFILGVIIKIASVSNSAP